jgi:exopolysaccharide production protein ExoQ
MPSENRRFTEPDYRKRPDERALIGRDSTVLDFLFVSAPFFALLFNQIIGPLTPVLVIATVGAYFVLRYERLGRVFGATWPLLLLPLLCIASALWSDAPGNSMRYGTLYLLTVIAAIIVGAGTDRTSALKGMQIAFTCYLLLSVLVGRWTAWGDGQVAFAGLAASKNAAGDAAGLGLLISVSMVFWAIGRRSLGWGLLALVSVPPALYSLFFSQSTGAWLASALALSCLLPWAISRKLQPATRAAVFTIFLLVGVVVAASSPFWMGDILNTLLESSGKDTKITGRADLWIVADEYIARQPLVGVGYAGFWVEGNLDAEALWRLLGLQSGATFNFHNTFRGIAVELGLIGLVAFLIVWLYCGVRLFWRTMVVPSYFGIFFCTIIAFILPRLHFEQIGFSDLHFPTLLMIAGLAAGLRPARPSSARSKR